MTKIAVVIPSWDLPRALKTVSNLKEYSKGCEAEIKYAVSFYAVQGLYEADERVEGYEDVLHLATGIPLGVVASMRDGVAPFLSGVWFQPDIIVFCHDDIEVYEDWASPLITAFGLNGQGRIPLNIGLIGFHGAKGLGSEDIYRTSYRLEQLARFNPMSNMVDAESHGKRVTLFTEVATVDGFFMAFSAQAYKDVGGWDDCLRDGIPFHMYDSWAAMRIRELGYQTYMAPVSCKHYGGQTEVGMVEEFNKWAIRNGFKDGNDVHVQGHANFYKRFRGQLPVRIR